MILCYANCLIAGALRDHENQWNLKFAIYLTNTTCMHSMLDDQVQLLNGIESG